MEQDEEEEEEFSNRHLYMYLLVFHLESHSFTHRWKLVERKKEVKAHYLEHDIVNVHYLQIDFQTSTAMIYNTPPHT